MDSSQELDIVLFVPGMDITPANWTERSLGGSETAGISMAVALGALGHRVTMFCNVSQGQRHHGVSFAPLQQYEEYVCRFPHDVLIAQRMPEALALRTASRLNLLWQHDLPTQGTHGSLKAALGNIDKCLLVSNFHRETYQASLGSFPSLYHVTRNGIDPSLFEEHGDVTRTDNEIIYGARPERGLDVLLRDVMPKIWLSRPDVVLSICTYDCPAPEMRPFYQQIDALIERHLRDGRPIQRLGALSKTELCRAYSRASLYVYPTPSPNAPEFAEVSCISAMECMAAGLPFVSTARGALPETLAPAAGVLLDTDPTEAGFAAVFAETVLQLLDDPARRNAMGTAGRVRAKELSWSALAEEWTSNFWRWIDERNESPSRLVHHLINHSDIFAARYVVEKMPAGIERDKFIERLERGPWSFAFTGDWHRPYVTPAPAPFNEEALNAGQRFRWLAKQLESRTGRRMLEVGAGSGEYQIAINNWFVRKNLIPCDWVGLDISPKSVQLAKDSAQQNSLCPNRHSFRVNDPSLSLDTAFDGLVAFEVLEHVEKPWELLNQLERWLTPASEVFITVPSGPWEALSFEETPRREHVWHFDRHDLQDMFGDKSNVRITYQCLDTSKRDGTPLGWWFVRYTVGNRPVQPIDLDRHVRLQRPRQTLSALLMGGPGDEETLHWSLRSIRPLANQIVLIDNSLSEEALRIARQYDVELHTGMDPRIHGFSAPRNLGLGFAESDWILWIDTDERLEGSSNLTSYLRKNVYDAYSLKQCNFSCDAEQDHQNPTRLFRNNGARNDGKSIQFVGHVHELAETAVNEGAGLTALLSDVFLAHVGYLNTEARFKKFQRNALLLDRERQELPSRMVGTLGKLRDNQQVVSFLHAQAHGVVGPEIRAICDDTINLFTSTFLGAHFDPLKFAQVGMQALQYYASALTMLGRGFELNWSVPSTPSQEPPTTLRGRFQNMTEAQTAISWSMQLADSSQPMPSYVGSN